MIENDYTRRNEILLRMGFKSYGEYLASSLWMQIRTKVYEIKGRDCSLCGKGSFAIHHRNYNEPVLKGRDLSPLVPICYGCHDKIEFNEDKSKRGIDDVDKEYKRILREREQQKTARERQKVEEKLKQDKQCRVCGQLPKKGTSYCKNHNPIVLVKKVKLPKIQLPKEGAKGCTNCGMKKRRGRKYCPRCWDKENNRVREAPLK